MVHIQLHGSLYQTVDVTWYQWNGEVNLRLLPHPSSLHTLLLRTPSFLQHQHLPTTTTTTTTSSSFHPSTSFHPSSPAMFARARALEGGTLMAWSQMAATRQAMWHRARKGAHVRTHPYTISHSHFLSLMNSHELFITHTCTYTLTHASHRARTQLLSATEGSATSLYFIIISLGIFLGCKGIPGGARPLKLSTPPPSSPPFPPHCTPSLFPSLWVLVILSQPVLQFCS